MSIWVCFCSARPAGYAQRTIDAWRDKGYLVYVMRPLKSQYVRADWLTSEGVWEGWAKAMNTLHRELMDYPGNPSDWIASAADDVLPDPNHSPEEIAESCREYFKGSLGVMQPWGDDWYAETLSVGHPWLGREYILRANEGRGVFWPEYVHYFADLHLGEVSQRQGLLWKRYDLSHRHENWHRMGEERPSHLDRAYEFFLKDEALFNKLKSEGFPGSDLLPAGVGSDTARTE